MVVKVTGPLSFWWIILFPRELLVCQKQILGYVVSKKTFTWIPKKTYPWIRFPPPSISLDTLFPKKNISLDTLFPKKRIPRVFGGFLASQKSISLDTLFQKSISLDTRFPKKQSPGYAFSKNPYPSCILMFSSIPEKHIHPDPASTRAYP